MSDEKNNESKTDNKFITGYALMHCSTLNGGCCNTGYEVNDIMLSMKYTEIYTNPNKFIEEVNKAIKDIMDNDCAHTEACSNLDLYCGKEHNERHTYPHGTKITLEQLEKITCLDTYTDNAANIIIDEPVCTDKKYNGRCAYWIAKFKINI